MEQHLLNYIPQELIIFGILFFIVIIVLIYPRLRIWMKGWVKNDGVTINERFDAYEKENMKKWEQQNSLNKEFDDKLNSDFRRLNVLESAVSERIINEQKTQYELYLLMKAVLTLLHAVKSDSTEDVDEELTSYVLKQSHKYEQKKEDIDNE